MNLPERITAYLLACFVGAGVTVWLAIQQTQERLATDPSAGAWMGFLPFFLPVFVLEVVIYVAPAAVAIEIGLAIWRRYGK